MNDKARRVLVLGASGLLGDHLLRRLPHTFSTIAPLGRGDRIGIDASVTWIPMRLDAADHQAIGPLLDTADASVIVNAIGAPRQSDAVTLATVNARFPHALAAAAAARGSRVVQISTDAVFSGSRGGYAERDQPDPSDDYGRSKLDGELAAPHLTIRTSFFGRSPRGTGLMEWFVAKRGGAVDGFTDYRFTGLAAPLAADFIALAVDAALDGVFHVGGEAMTKYELLCAVSRRLELDIAVRPASREAVDRTLDTRRFFDAIGRRRPTFTESIEALASCGVLSQS